MGMLCKFGKRQLLSFGLPEMPMVWLTRVSGDSVVDSQGVPGQSVCEILRASSELQGEFSSFHLHFSPSRVDTEMTFSPAVLVPFCGFCPSFACVLPLLSPVSTTALC